MNDTIEKRIKDLEYIDWITDNLDKYKIHGDVANKAYSDFLKYAASPTVYYTSCLISMMDFYRLADNNPWNKMMGIMSYENYIEINDQDAYFIPYSFGEGEREEVYYVPVGFALKYDPENAEKKMKMLEKDGKKKLSNRLVEIHKKIDGSLSNMGFIEQLSSKTSVGKDSTKTTKKTRLEQYKSRLLWEKFIHLFLFLLWVYVSGHYTWNRVGVFKIIPLTWFRSCTENGGFWGSLGNLLIVGVFVYICYCVFILTTRGVAVRRLENLTKLYDKLVSSKNIVGNLYNEINSKENGNVNAGEDNNAKLLAIIKEANQRINETTLIKGQSMAESYTYLLSYNLDGKMVVCIILLYMVHIFI